MNSPADARQSCPTQFCCVQHLLRETLQVLRRARGDRRSRPLVIQAIHVDLITDWAPPAACLGSPSQLLHLIPYVPWSSSSMEYVSERAAQSLVSIASMASKLRPYAQILSASIALEPVPPESRSSKTVDQVFCIAPISRTTYTVSVYQQYIVRIEFQAFHFHRLMNFLKSIHFWQRRESRE